jgi:hypothetical protein
LNPEFEVRDPQSGIPDPGWIKIRIRDIHHGSATLVTKVIYGLYRCAAKAFYSCPAIISRRPRYQNTSKEPQLNSEKDSRRKQARSHVTLEKSS